MTDQTPEAPEVAVEPVAAEAVPQAPPEPEAAEPVRDEAAEAAIQAASGEALARWAARAALDEAGPGISLGEQPHDPGNCDRGGQPHLGPCVEPEPVAEAPEPAPEGEAVLAAHPEWAYLFSAPAAPVRPALTLRPRCTRDGRPTRNGLRSTLPSFPQSPLSPLPRNVLRPVSGAPAIGSAAS